MGEHVHTEQRVEIAGDGLVLRRLIPEDAQAYFDALHHNPKRFEHGQEKTLANYPTVETVLQSILQYDPDVLRLGIWDEDLFTAYAKLTFNRPRAAEVGYWSGYGGRHYTERAVGILVPYAFANFDIDRITAWVHPDNEGSIKTLERNGFQRLISNSTQLFFETTRASEDRLANPLG